MYDGLAASYCSFGALCPLSLRLLVLGSQNLVRGSRSRSCCLYAHTVDEIMYITRNQELQA